MAPEEIEHAEEQPPQGGGRLVAAGVAGAVVLGALLGFWARPEAHERGAAHARPALAKALEPSKDRALEIVVDDAPAPVGRPLEVLPAAEPAPPPPEPAPAPVEAAPPPVDAMPLAPKGPPAGLVKVEAPAPPPPARRIEPAKPKHARMQEAKAETPAPVKAAKVEAPVKSARREPARKPVELAQSAKARREEPAAKPHPAGPLLALVRAVKAAPRRLAEPVKTAARRPADDVAETNPSPHRPKAEHGEKPALIKASAPKPEPKPAAKARSPQPARVAHNDCASSDPGEALVCADPRLGVRERQLQRAYRNAEAAGVPSAELARQQQRWLQARAAAAREAPWAVEEVYEARIAELNDLSRSR